MFLNAVLERDSMGVFGGGNNVEVFLSGCDPPKITGPEGVHPCK